MLRRRKSRSPSQNLEQLRMNLNFGTRCAIVWRIFLSQLQPRSHRQPSQHGAHLPIQVSRLHRLHIVLTAARATRAMTEAREMSDCECSHQTLLAKPGPLRP